MNTLIIYYKNFFEQMKDDIKKENICYLKYIEFIIHHFNNIAVNFSSC